MPVNFWLKVYNFLIFKVVILISHPLLIIILIIFLLKVLNIVFININFQLFKYFIIINRLINL